MESLQSCSKSPIHWYILYAMVLPQSYYRYTTGIWFVSNVSRILMGLIIIQNGRRDLAISLYFSDTELSSFWGHFRHWHLGFSVGELRLCLHHYHPISWRRGFYRRRSTSGGETGWLVFGLFQYDSSTYWPSLLIRLAPISQYDLYSQLDCLAMT